MKIPFILVSFALHFFLISIAMENHAITLFYDLTHKSSYAACTPNHCKLSSIDDVYYQTKDHVDNFNSFFNPREPIPYNMPFTPIQLHTNKAEGVEYLTTNNGHQWPIGTYGIPLFLLKQELITLGNYQFKKAPQAAIDFAQLEQVFKQYPLGHSYCFKYSDRSAQEAIIHLLKLGIIEKDGDGYSHGPNSYFAKDALALITSRINNFVQKNNRYTAIPLLVLLQRT